MKQQEPTPLSADRPEERGFRDTDAPGEEVCAREEIDGDFDEFVGPTVSEILRGIVEDSGFSFRRISRATGIHPTTLRRFVDGEVGLTLRSVDALAACMDLQLVDMSEARAGDT